MANRATEEIRRFPATKENPRMAIARAPMRKIDEPTTLAPKRTVRVLANKMPASPPNGKSITKSPI